jgi:hypothetical protein
VLNAVARVEEFSFDRKLGGLNNTSKFTSLPEVRHLSIIIWMHGSAEVCQLVRSAIAAPILLREA